MQNATDFAAYGRVLRLQDNLLVFQPANSQYELHLAWEGPADPALVGQRIGGEVEVTARKVWTVPSGGNFIVPIFGPPRIVQGRIRHLEPGRAVVHATIPFIVNLPADEDAYDLARGPLAVGTIINATLLPNACFKLLLGAAEAVR